MWNTDAKHLHFSRAAFSAHSSVGEEDREGGKGRGRGGGREGGREEQRREAVIKAMSMPAIPVCIRAYICCEECH